jgi:RNA polymerase sigma-70 factor (ECF subfamily)
MNNTDNNSTDADPDDGLMLRLKQGDQAAFNELVERHSEGLRNFFRARSHSVRARQMCEDLAQETLLRVYHESRDFIPQGRFKAWMYRIARNLLVDTMRRHAYDALLGNRAGGDSDDQLRGLTSSAQAIVDAADTHEIGDLVADLLQELPEEQRLTFQTHHYLGLSLPEVAEVMETNTATTKSRLRLAREKLREKLSLRGINFDWQDEE